MQIDTINTMIDEAVADERANGRVADLFREVGERQGIEQSDDDVAAGVAFVEQYVRAVPVVLAEALKAAEGTHAHDKVQRMVDAATAYWREDDDIIPDHLGLLGIMDDAFTTLRLLQVLSERFAADTGGALVSADLSGSNEAIRNLLGPDASGRLEDYVDSALSDASVTELLSELMDEPPPPPPPTDSSLPDLIPGLLGI